MDTGPGLGVCDLPHTVNDNNHFSYLQGKFWGFRNWGTELMSHVNFTLFNLTLISTLILKLITIPRVMLNYLCKRLVKVCYKFDPIYRLLTFFCESFSRF